MLSQIVRLGTAAALGALFGLLAALPRAEGKPLVKPIKPIQEWSGIVKDDTLQKEAPKDGFIADEKAWAKLWKAWRSDEKQPKVDFDKELVLVATADGPNRVFLVGDVDDTGGLVFNAGSTKIAGKGFGYKIVVVSREGVKTVNRKKIAKD